MGKSVHRWEVVNPTFVSLFLKEIPFASLTNAIDVKIERVLTGFLIG
jgi:hypothetical protein